MANRILTLARTHVWLDSENFERKGNRTAFLGDILPVFSTADYEIRETELDSESLKEDKLHKSGP